MSKDRNKDLNQSSSSTSVGHLPLVLGIEPIFIQPILPPSLEDAKVQNKMEALDLSKGIKNQKRFENFGQLDSKGCKAKKEEAEIEDAEE
jgi:hypothetical protein